MSDATLYQKLEATAGAFVKSCNPRTPGSNDADADELRRYLHPDAITEFGHDFFVSTTPGFQGQSSREEFITHLCTKGSNMQTWQLIPGDCCVDVRKCSVVLRVESRMVAKGSAEVVNDAIFWLTLDKSGEQVVRLTEFLDPFAVKELGARMQASAKQ